MAGIFPIFFSVVQVAGLDPLRDEGFAYTEKLKAAGVKVQLEQYAGLPRCFGGPTELPATKAYFEHTVNSWGVFAMRRTKAFILCLQLRSGSKTD